MTANRTLDELKRAVELIEPMLADQVFIVVKEFERDGRKLEVALTQRLRKACKKGGVWKSKAMLTALKNAEYGFDPSRAHSPGGYDGMFVLTREFRPKNAMIKKIFDRFLDKEGGPAESIAEALDVPLDELVPVRLVSHHMRLLGLLARGTERDRLVLVDYDATR